MCQRRGIKITGEEGVLQFYVGFSEKALAKRGHLSQSRQENELCRYLGKDGVETAVHMWSCTLHSEPGESRRQGQ